MSVTLSLFRAIEQVKIEKGRFLVNTRTGLLGRCTIFIDYKQARRIAFSEVIVDGCHGVVGSTVGTWDGSWDCWMGTTLLWSLAQNETEPHTLDLIIY